MTVVSRVISSAACVAIAISWGIVAGSAPVAAEEAGDTLEVMGDYTASDYLDQADELPADLVDAIERDLGQSPEQYLADSDAAVQASDVVDSLETSGVTVLGSSIDGTDLTVYVDSDAAAQLVESVGAEAIIGEPVPTAPLDEPLSFAEDIYGGQGFYWEKTTDSNGYQCSIGFNGYDAGGSSQFVTAGHCTNNMDHLEGAVRAMNMTAPGAPQSVGQLGGAVGGPVAGTSSFGSGFDVGRIAVTGAGIVARPAVLTWGGGTGAPLSSTPLAITRQVTPTVGAKLCKSGSRSGWTCGPIVDVSSQSVEGSEVNSIVAQVCVMPGDSGGAAMIGTAAVGITSWRSGSSCGSSSYGGFMPMQVQDSGASVASAYGASWELAVSVSTPVAAGSGTPALGSSMVGSLANASGPSQVWVFVDGSNTPLASSAASGSWSVSLAGLAPGLHKYNMVALYGSHSVSSWVSGYFTTGLTSDRLAGSDRYETGLAIVNSHYSPGIPVVYVSTGQAYPDALSAGSAAVHLGGPVLLVQPGGISQSIANTIANLAPQRVVVLGQSNGVSDHALNQIRGIVPNTYRIAGVDRYDTSRQIARDAFINQGGSHGATSAFIVSGQNFPDALSAGPAAATVDSPVILVYGSGDSLPNETIALLRDLGVSSITIAGSAASVSGGIEIQLAQQGYAVQRLGGSNRYETSQLINNRFFSPSEPVVFLASGANYPDALAGSALAGALGAPLFTTPSTCVNGFTLDEINRLKAPKVTLLGGPPSLDGNVATLTKC